MPARPRRVLLRIVAPHFVCGVVFVRSKQSGKLRAVRCAPIVKYMKGWIYVKVMHYCEKKKWHAYNIGMTG